MTTDYITTLFDYHYGLYRRVWASVHTLTDAQFVQDVPYSNGSLRNHLVHVASVDQRWLARVTDSPPPDRLNPVDFPTIKAAQAKWDAVEAAVLAQVHGLEQAALDRVIAFDITRQDGTRIATQHPAWQILAHVVNHGTDHRAQLLAVLHQMGAPTFEQDLMIYLWNK